MKIRYLLGAAAFALLITTPVAAISEAQSGAISQHCSSIKQSLKSLQRADARTRSYLGTAYENFLSDFISPLNIRLTNNDQPSATLADIHSKLISSRQAFNQRYTAYSQSLDELINSDCQTNPAGFYDKLLVTRYRRAELENTVTDIRRLLELHKTSVTEIQTTLRSNNEQR